MKPEDTIDKFIAYDNDHGACWAKIKSVFVTPIGKYKLITNFLKIRHNETVSTWDNSRVLDWDSLKETVKVIDPNNKEDIEDIAFIQILGENDKKQTALSLGIHQLCGHIYNKL